MDTKIKNQKFQLGAALLITMLLIGSVGALALAVSRIILSELKITTSYSDSVVAYQAAEAGIEDGLLKFRFNRNIEQDLQPVSMNNGAKYDLNINYKNQDGKVTGELKKDESIELDVSNKPFPISIDWHGKTKPGGVKHTGWVEWRILGSNNTESEWHLIPLSDAASSDGSGVISATVLNPQILRIKFLSKEDDAAITYTLSSAKALDSTKTKIESLGIYGKSQRKLVAEIDRKSGAIIGIFDYTLYAGEGDIK